MAGQTVAGYIEVEKGHINQDRLVVEYASMVQKIAHHLSSKLPASVQLDDLIQAGMIGLLEASKNYDPQKGASFETFASIRIRGAMLDEVRREDWVPRSMHRNSRMISTAIRIVENQLGRNAKDHEIAEQLDISIEDYHKLIRNLAGGQMMGFDDVGLKEDALENGLHINRTNPFDDMEQRAFNENLTRAIEHLPDREKLVLSLYYDDELNLKEIGLVLGVSESRVCQIHAQAMMRLKAKMEDWQ